MRIVFASLALFALATLAVPTASADHNAGYFCDQANPSDCCSGLVDTGCKNSRCSNHDETGRCWSWSTSTCTVYVDTTRATGFFATGAGTNCVIV